MIENTKEFQEPTLKELAKRGPRKWYKMGAFASFALLIGLALCAIASGIYLPRTPLAIIGFGGALSFLYCAWFFFYTRHMSHNVRGYRIWWYYTEEQGYPEWKYTTKEYPRQAKSWVIQFLVNAKPEWDLSWGRTLAGFNLIEVPESVQGVLIRVNEYRHLNFVPMHGGTVLQVWETGAGFPPPVRLEFDLLEAGGLGISASAVLRDILAAGSVSACFERADRLARTLLITQETQAALTMRVAGVLRTLQSYNSSRPTGMVLPRQTVLQLASALDEALPANDPLRREFRFPEIVAQMDAWLERYAADSRPN